MASQNFAIAVLAIDSSGNLVTFFAKRNTFGVEAEVHTFVFEDFPNFGRNIRIFTANQARPHLDDGDFPAETTEHLSKLEADIATADDNEMPWKKVDLHHRRVREIWNLIDTRHIWNAGADTGIDKEFVGRKPVAIDFDFFWRHEARVSLENGNVFIVA